MEIPMCEVLLNPNLKYHKYIKVQLGLSACF